LWNVGENKSAHAYEIHDFYENTKRLILILTNTRDGENRFVNIVNAVPTAMIIPPYYENYFSCLRIKEMILQISMHMNHQSIRESLSRTKNYRKLEVV
jgi:hypothetical protein